MHIEYFKFYNIDVNFTIKTVHTKQYNIVNDPYRNI